MQSQPPESSSKPWTAAVSIIKHETKEHHPSATRRSDIDLQSPDVDVGYINLLALVLNRYNMQLYATFNPVLGGLGPWDLITRTAIRLRPDYFWGSPCAKA